MHARDDHGRTRLGVFVVVLAIAVAGLFGFVPSAGAAPTQPSNDPTSTTSPVNSLPITLNLLGIKLTVTVPSLNQLLHLGGPASTPPTTSTPPPATSTPPPTSSAPKPSRTHTVTTPPPAQFAGGPTIVAPPPKTSTAPSTSSSKPRPSHSRAPQPIAEPVSTILRNLLPTSLARALYLVTFLAAIGIAVGIMRLGRRGSH